MNAFLWQLFYVILLPVYVVTYKIIFKVHILDDFSDDFYKKEHLILYMLSY